MDVYSEVGKETEKRRFWTDKQTDKQTDRHWQRKRRDKQIDTETGREIHFNAKKVHRADGPEICQQNYANKINTRTNKHRCSARYAIMGNNPLAPILRT